VLFKLRGGLTLALYPRTELAKDANVTLEPPKTGKFSIGHVVSSKAEVDLLDGHLWEIIWNPSMGSSG
jgi:uncharacterized protein